MAEAYMGEFMSDDVHDFMGWAFAEISNEYHEDIVSLSTRVQKEFNRRPPPCGFPLE
jgi:hypothetical protein